MALIEQKTSTSLNPDLRELGVYTDSSQKRKALAMIGDVCIVDSSGSPIEMSTLEDILQLITNLKSENNVSIQSLIETLQDSLLGTDSISLINLLELITDEQSNIKVNVKLPINLKQEADGGLILADMKGPFTWYSRDATQPFIMDCTGYLSMIVHKSTTGVVTPYASNDGQNWAATLATAISTTTPAATILTAAGIYVVPVTGKFIKLVGPASSIQCTIYLSRQPHTPNSTLNNVPFNLAQVAGTTTVTSGLSGMIAAGGNIAPGIAPTANPINIGGADALKTPLTRRMLTNLLGMQMIGTYPGQDSTLLNVLGNNPALRNILEVQDTTITEKGLKTQDLLYSILIEMRVMNWIMYEGFRGTPMIDEPDAVRNDLTMIKDL